MGDASPKQIRHLAMDYLARREHGFSELVSKLVQRGVDSSEAEQVVQQLAMDGLQDDQRFAEMYLRAQAERGRGPLYIRNGLCQRGISRFDARETIYKSHFDWTESAKQVALKKYGSEPCDYAQRATRVRFLLQRGFTREQIDSALRLLVSEAKNSIDTELKL